MSLSTQTVRYGSKVISFSVIRRDRRTMQISVLPDMTVEVVAPKASTEAAIQKRVTKRAAWIIRQIQFFRQFHPKTPDRKYEPGETHLYLGRRYRLRVEPAKVPSVVIKGGFIIVAAPRHDDKEAVRKHLDEWLRSQARKRFQERLEACLTRFGRPSTVEPIALIVRQLRQRWGSMSPAGRLMLNRSLIQAAVPEIDYVITHELCHHIHHHHGAAFFDLLDRVMSDWKQRKMSLERRLA